MEFRWYVALEIYLEMIVY